MTTLRPMVRPMVRPIARGVTQAGGGGGFSITSLFAAGEKGAWYDPSDLSSMYQDSAGTTPAVVNQPVGYIADKSGNGNHAKQATTASKPILRQSGGLYYLQFDGVDDSLSTGSIDFTSTDKMTVVAGARLLSNAAAGVFAELSVSVSANNGSFVLLVPLSASSRYGFYSRGTATSQPFTGNDYTAPVSSVLTGTSEISADACALRVNGTVVATPSTDQGTGNYGNYPLYIGRRAGSTNPFNGYLYSLIVRGAATADVTGAEQYVATKTGVTLP